MADMSTASRSREGLSFKRQVVAETFADGATKAGVARQHGIDTNMLFLCRQNKLFSCDVDTTPQFQPVGIKRHANAVDDQAVSTQPADITRI